MHFPCNLNNKLLYVHLSYSADQCKALFQSLSKSGSETRFLWRQLKPFVRGCVLYYPQNEVTENIINNVRRPVIFAKYQRSLN